MATVRFYHGGHAYHGGTRWLSPDLRFATGWAKKTGGFVHYVDIDENSPHLIEASDTSGTSFAKDYAPFDAPEHIAAKLKPLKAPSSSSPSSSQSVAGGTPPLSNSTTTISTTKSSGGSSFNLNTSRLAAKLANIIKTTEGLPRVSVGFLQGATYPDGTPVATVATINEFGNSANGQPPRMFFRLMVAEKRNSWPDDVKKLLKSTDYDAHKTLDVMGQVIKGQLQQSIKDTNDPPLAASTIKRKGFSKPLIDTAVMLNSIDYRVED